MKWFKDPDEILRNEFFKYHYPCSSVVVIAPSGEFESLLGEHDSNWVIGMVDRVFHRSKR